MVDGAFFFTYHDNLGVQQRASTIMDVENQVLDSSSYCCLAYQKTGEINTSLELLYACEELTEPDAITYEIRDGVCVVNTISFMYVDRNANMMYDAGVDE